MYTGQQIIAGEGGADHFAGVSIVAVVLIAKTGVLRRKNTGVKIQMWTCLKKCFVLIYSLFFLILILQHPK